MNQGTQESKQGPNKHLLFFSNFCHYSKDLMNIVVKKNVKNMFLFINVDDIGKKYTLPPVVDRVPMIITNTKVVVTDDQILEFLDAIAPREESISPFSLETGGFFSDNFSTIDGKDDCSDDFCRGFLRLNAQESKVDPSAAEMFVSKDEKSDKSTAAYDRLLSERDQDIKQYN